MMLLGKLGSVWGVKGQIKAFSESGDLKHFTSLSSVLIGENEAKVKAYEIEETRVHSGQVLFKFKGIETPEAVRRLTGALIWVSREKATPLKKGEFYFSDLVGFELFSQTGEALGSVKSILYGGRQTLLEIIRADSSSFLVPMAEPFVLELMEAEKKIVVDKELVL